MAKRLYSIEMQIYRTFYWTKNLQIKKYCGEAENREAHLNDFYDYVKRFQLSNYLQIAGTTSQEEGFWALFFF